MKFSLERGEERGGGGGGSRRGKDDRHERKDLRLHNRRELGKKLFYVLVCS
jgi:hypothetical protein